MRIDLSGAAVLFAWLVGMALLIGVMGYTDHLERVDKFRADSLAAVTHTLNPINKK